MPKEIKEIKDVSKISVKTVVGTKKKILDIISENNNKKTAIMRVAGVAFKYVNGNSDYGEWSAMKGKFNAMNLLTGEIFEGVTLYLPEKALTELIFSISSGSKTVKVGMDIYVTHKEDDGNNSGYVYDFVNHIESRVDAISSIMRSLPEIKGVKFTK